jgi:hypothetical protein
LSYNFNVLEQDLACILGANPSAFRVNAAEPPRGIDWYTRWSRYFANQGGSTSAQYGAATQAEFVCKFPAHHYNYLESLPWYIILDQYIFVHAGLRAAGEESVTSQLAYLDSKDLSDLSKHVYQGGGYGLPDQLCNKHWSRTNDPAWGAVVVTGHNKYAKKYTDNCPDFVESHRIGFHSCSCAISLNRDLPLHCALLSRGPKGSTVPLFPPTFYEVRYDEE